MAISLLGDAMLYAVLPAKAASMGIPIALVGVLLSVNRWVRIATNFGAAGAFARWGARRSMIAGSSLAIGSTLTYGVFPFFAAMLPARLAWGTAFSLLRLGAYNAVLATSTERNRGRVMGMFQSITWLGSMTGALVGGILTESVGFRTTAIAFGLAGFLSLALSSRVGKSLDRLGDSPNRRVDIREIVALLKWSPEFRVIFVTLVGSLAGTGVVVPTIGLLLFTTYGDNVDVFGMMTGVAAVAGVLVAMRFGTETLFAPVSGFVSDRHGRRFTAIVTGAAMVAGLVILFFSGSLVSIAIGAIIVFSAASGFHVALSAWTADLARGGDWTIVMSGFATFRDAGTALGPLLALPAAAIFGVHPTYAVAAGLLVIAFALLPAARPSGRSP
ncbi:MAG: MFS transporter [Chloroflexi bacterium]|nr:MFS transporter [Chloroflexota bacterium]